MDDIGRPPWGCHSCKQLGCCSALFCIITWKNLISPSRLAVAMAVPSGLRIASTIVPEWWQISVMPPQFISIGSVSFERK